jgi:hypothetical protein
MSVRSADIAIAGFLLTVDEWRELDAPARAELVAAAGHRHDDPWIVASIADVLADGSGPLAARSRR